MEQSHDGFEINKKSTRAGSQGKNNFHHNNNRYQRKHLLDGADGEVWHGHDLDDFEGVENNNRDNHLPDCNNIHRREPKTTEVSQVREKNEREKSNDRQRSEKRKAQIVIELT